MPNDDERIRRIVREEMSRGAVADKFRMNPVSRHVHNGIDSPFAFQPSMSYGGIVQLDGLGLVLPKGWTVTYNSTGSYTITHNLNTTFYAAMVSPILSITLPVASVTPGDDRFDVTWTDTGTPVDPRAAVDTSFTFLLVDLTNKNETPPQYFIHPQVA